MALINLAPNATLTIVSTGSTLIIATIDGATATIGIGGAPTLRQTIPASNKTIIIDRPKTLTLAKGNTYLLSAGNHTLVGSY